MNDGDVAYVSKSLSFTFYNNGEIVTTVKALKHQRKKNVFVDQFLVSQSR